MNNTTRSVFAGGAGSRSHVRPRRWALPLAIGLLALGACDGIDNLLRVDTPARLPAAVLEVPTNAALIVNSVVADFECAFGAYTVMGGLIGEELVDATQTADRMPYDRRSTQATDARYATQTCQNLGVYTPVQAARASADNALFLLRGWTDAQVPNRTRLIGTAAAYGGYSLVLLGEGFCTAAISTLDASRNPVYGGEIQRDSVFKLAVARFGEAIEAAQAAGDTDIMNMAYLGRARAYLNLGQYANARADAARIPGNYSRVVTASSASDRRQNRVWAQSSAVSDAVAVGEPYRSMNDPRVPVFNTGRTSVTGVPLWQQRKYLTDNTAIPLATWREAQLIIAEADARANSLTSALGIIATFRARGGQGAFTGTTQQQVLNEIVDQRRRELFLESHHLGDVIRYGITLSPAPGTSYHGGGTYGNQICLPLPNVERLANPNMN
jgi:starch-binding outer membrane protein, SusD/RagB family